MIKPINILILSCGSRNNIIQYFKAEIGDQGKIFAADCSKLAPALYDADDYFILPRLDSANYLDHVLQLCKDHEISGVLSLIDPELSILAEHADRFTAIGTTPIISSAEVIQTCFDKYTFYQTLVSRGMNAVKSYVDKGLFYQDLQAGEISYPVFVKPVRGSASINISRVHDDEELEFLFKRHEDLMIQEMMNGSEYGIDAYIDLISGEPVAIFSKEKLKMRAGETDKSISVKDEVLFDLVEEFITSFGFRGIIDIDVFKVEGKYYISEVNPRFGGGYPHAYGSGVNVPRMIINNLNGKPNMPAIGEYEAGTYMMKFNDVKIQSLGIEQQDLCEREN